MSKPMGRPRKLTPDHSREIAAHVIATKFGRRSMLMARLAKQLGVSVPTLERAVAVERRRRVASELACPVFHELHQKSSHTGAMP